MDSNQHASAVTSAEPDCGTETLSERPGVIRREGESRLVSGISVARHRSYGTPR